MTGAYTQPYHSVAIHRAEFRACESDPVRQNRLLSQIFGPQNGVGVDTRLLYLQSPLYVQWVWHTLLVSAFNLVWLFELK